MLDSSDLRNRGLKATLPRLQILELFQHSQPRHLSAEDIYRLLLEQQHEVGLATVYRVLSQLHQAGLLKQARFDLGRVLYELDDGTHHDHIVFNDCGRIQEFQDDQIERRLCAIAREHNCVLTEHTHILYGRCLKNPCEYRTHTS